MFISAAVCDFCKKKESELYQKEVNKLGLVCFLINIMVNES